MIPYLPAWLETTISHAEKSELTGDRGLKSCLAMIVALTTAATSSAL
jgi:hypothetical protein